jgi:hypothetical protein
VEAVRGNARPFDTDRRIGGSEFNDVPGPRVVKPIGAAERLEMAL